ncbi:MAG TPA: hypothetical protein VGP76_18220 [Planctomycetaceae bacterium]|jgi:hypothetical protein|nr:hypothetical protein [Planctomycetaceae bacterium]
MPRFGMTLSLLLLGGSLAPMATRPAPAAVKEFPYEAIIEADEAYVRCGPGKNFYTTMKLTRGQHVTVRRHDPGGWFMIDPPLGSFSLIRMEDVVQEGNIATVKRLDVGQASVRIGSSLDPTADSIFQRKLSSGERAEILGEVMIPRKDRQVPMFRIRPPRGEFRWIEGNDVAPLDPQIKQQQDSDPFSTPPQARQARRDPNHQSSSGAAEHLAAATGGQPTTQLSPTTSKPAVASRKNGSAAKRQVVIAGAAFDPRGRLEELDVQFRDMIQKEPPTWNLTRLEQSYSELRRNPAAGGVAPQIDLRFSALAHYKQVKSQYDDYYRLVSSTSQRDAELAAVENSLAPQNSRPAIGPTPQGGWPATAPSGEANYQAPAQGPAAPPTLSLPNYSPQVNPGSASPIPPNPGPPNPGQVNASPSNPDPQNAGTQEGAPTNPTPQPPSDGQNNSRQQNGLTLGTPVPLPLENSPPSGPTTSRPLSEAVISPSNSGTPGPSSGGSGNSSQGHAAQDRTSPTEPQASDLGIQSFPGEIGPGQTSPPPQTTRTHTSQFAPNSTGQSSTYPAAPASPSGTPQISPNTGLNPAFGQTAPGSAMGPPSPSPYQPSMQNPLPQSQPYFPNPQPSQQATPFVSQPPGMQQPGMQQPPMQQSPMQQPGSQQPNLLQNGSPPNGNAMPAMAPPRQIRPPGSPPLDGAGIVQRAAATSPNGPRYVLLAPNGRILAYLQPDRGINLDAYVGRPMGIMGLRTYRSELQADLIIVRGMMPVRLVQQ